MRPRTFYHSHHTMLPAVARWVDAVGALDNQNDPERRTQPFTLVGHSLDGLLAAEYA